MPFMIIIILMVAAAAVTALTSRGPQNTPATLSDFGLPQSIEGTPQAVIFGDVWLDDFTVLWFGNYRTQPIYATGKK